MEWKVFRNIFPLPTCQEDSIFGFIQNSLTHLAVCFICLSNFLAFIEKSSNKFSTIEFFFEKFPNSCFRMFLLLFLCFDFITSAVSGINSVFHWILLKAKRLVVDKFLNLFKEKVRRNKPAFFYINKNPIWQCEKIIFQH